MADLIQIKRGEGTTILADGELGYSREEKALYIGDGGTRNLKLCGLEGTTIDAVESVATLASNADISSVITTVNAIISSLKAGGIMKEG
jgi:hypothetical protein